MGVAAGDFDNDGWVDLYLTKFDAPNQLFRNNGDGTFTDVVEGERHRSALVERVGGVRGHRSRRLARSLRRQLPALHASRATRRARARRARPTTARPTAISRCRTGCTATSGDGTFADVTRQRAASPREFGPALGVSTADFNGDGWMDIYVANDGKENQLWMNRRDGTFENRALLAGVALPRQRQGRSAAWASTPATSTTTATKICS